MTDPQALRLWTLLLAAFPNQPLEAPTQALYLAHLKAIAWRDGRTESCLRGLVARSTTAFMPPIGAVVAACGVAPEAVHLLVEAMTTGVELVPDLASRTGWAVGTAERPLDALPAPEETFSEEERRANLARLGALARELGAKRSAS